MDWQTRFLLASKVSENRDANGDFAVLQEAIKNANGNLPDAATTEAHKSCREDISKTFQNMEHVAKCGVNKPHANYNRID